MSSLNINRDEMVAEQAKTLSPKRYRTKFLVWYLTVRLTMFIKRVFGNIVSFVLVILFSPLFITVILITIPGVRSWWWRLR